MKELDIKFNLGKLKRSLCLILAAMVVISNCSISTFAANVSSGSGTESNNQPASGNEPKSVTLSEKSISFSKYGKTKKLGVTVKFTDDAPAYTVEWLSDDNEVATVEDGLVTAVGNGTTTITAKVGNKSDKCTVTVSAAPAEVTALTLSSSTLSFTKIGETKTLTATVGVQTPDGPTAEVAWSTSNAKVATVSNGVVKAVGNGTATITAKAGNKEAKCTVTVNSVVDVTGVTLNSTSLSFTKVGETKTLTATVLPSNATTKTVTWSTSNAKVATVSNGVVKAVGNGTATITAKAGNKEAKCTVTVNSVVDVTGVTLNSKEVSFDTIGVSKTLTATVLPSNATTKTVTWSTSNAKVATVSNGVVKAVGNGTATITAKAGNKSASCVVTVSQKSTSVKITLAGQKISGTLKAKVKGTYSLKAVVSPTNADSKNAAVTWSTSNKKIATVTKAGKVKILKAGTVTITAKTADGKTAKVKFKATKTPVKVTKVKITGNKTMKVKGKQTLSVTISPATADNQKLTWTSSNKKVATVSSKGVVKAKKAGTVKITAKAKDGSGKKYTFTIKVKK